MCMGIYQLYQLYLIDQAFEATKYPNWVFICVIIMSIIGGINILTCPVLFIQKTCGINRKFEYYYALTFKQREIFSIWIAILNMSLVIYGRSRIDFICN